MNSLLGLVSISALFIFLSSIIYYLSKKNFFSSNSEKTKSIDKVKGIDSTNTSKLERLKRENDELNKEINFLVEKNKRLRFKITEMKEVIKNLQEQKSQLVESEKKLKDLRVQKDETLAMVAHDLKNPASTIKNFVELLESYDLSAQEQQDVLSGLMETSSRLVRLANEFTQVISEEYVPFCLNKTQNNLQTVVESIVKANKIKAAKKNIDIRLYQPQEDLEIEIDEGKIKEVIDNFLANAVKYCPEKSKVEVKTEVFGNSVKIEVSDNGYGLTEYEISKAFDKGSKFSSTINSEDSSTGLGLWIAKKIVEQHDGKVWVKSKKGFGSTFSFTLPLK